MCILAREENSPSLYFVNHYHIIYFIFFGFWLFVIWCFISFNFDSFVSFELIACVVSKAELLNQTAS